MAADDQKDETRFNYHVFPLSLPTPFSPRHFSPFKSLHTLPEKLATLIYQYAFCINNQVVTYTDYNNLHICFLSINHCLDLEITAFVPQIQ